MKKRERLDTFLVNSNMASSRARAQAMIMAGRVYVNGRKTIKKDYPVTNETEVRINDSLGYVSRGGLKLESAIQVFKINVKDKVCLDVGASTGGFTDCLLKRGAKMVYALDVGKGQLDWKLRNNPRVINMEKTNIRYFTEKLDPAPILAAVDVSFISLEKVLPRVKELLERDGEIIALIKPQFEAPRGSAKKGVVKDEKTRRDVVSNIKNFVKSLQLKIEGVVPSPVKGPKGNVEFFIYLRKQE